MNDIKARVGNLLQTNKYFKLIEIFLLFLIALILIKILVPFAKDNLIMKQAVFWLVNIVMLFLVWIGLKLRNETWTHFGLSIKKLSPKSLLKGFLLSLLVFIFAIVGFVIGSIIMANITGIPESADMNNYSYLQGNIGMLILTLFGVYIVSSFGEEVIYRGFLINRISELGLNNKIGLTISVIISAIIFGFIHYEWGAMGIVQTGFMGLALGLCYIYMKKKLWIMVFAHAYMDTILMLQLYFTKS
jgi:membrane protease YdiL (CAAX protease family)